MNTAPVARISRPARSAMQSGKARTRRWLLEFERLTPRTTEPLMGWVSSGDVSAMVRLAFATREQAEAYARRQGLAYTIAPPQQPKRIIKSYADNFR